MAYKITRSETEGPLRTGLKMQSEKLAKENGAELFSLARDLANEILDVVLDLEQNYNLGDSDNSIPKTYHSVKVSRERGEYQR